MAARSASEGRTSGSPKRKRGGGAKGAATRRGQVAQMVPYPTPVKVQRAGKGQAPPRTLPQRSKFVQVFRRALPPEPPEQNFVSLTALPLSSSSPTPLARWLVVACNAPSTRQLSRTYRTRAYHLSGNRLLVWLHRRSLLPGSWPGPSVLALTFLARTRMGTSRRWPDRPFARAGFQWLSPPPLLCFCPLSDPSLSSTCLPLARQGLPGLLPNNRPTSNVAPFRHPYLVQRQHQLPHHPDHRTLRFRAHRVASSP